MKREHRIDGTMIVAGYRNKRVVFKMKHPNVFRGFAQRLICGYEPVKILGYCEECGEPVLSIFEYTEDADGLHCCI